MSKSIKPKDNTYWDSTGIVNGRTPLPDYLYWIDKLTMSNKNVWTTTNDGIRIVVNKYVNDKMPIVVLGVDNSKFETPVITVIRAYSNTAETYSAYTTLGYARTVTRKGNTYHVQASQYSTYWILAPMGAEITVSNASL